MFVQTLNVGPLQACCYIVAPEDGMEAAIIDPGGDAELLVEQLDLHGYLPALVLLTHGHIDHIAAVADLKTAFPDAQICIHEADADMLRDPSAALASFTGLPFDACEPDRLIADGDSIELGSIAFQVVHTPGHTQGGVSFLVRQPGGPDVVFSGDTLFAGGIGRTDFPGGDFGQLLDSIRDRLFALAPETVVYPGHGEASTIGEERGTNPWVKM